MFVDIDDDGDDNDWVNKGNGKVIPLQACTGQ
jgi:hypothetical protein